MLKLAHISVQEDETAASKKQDAMGRTEIQETIPLHTDSGVLVAMTIGLGLEVTSDLTLKERPGAYNHSGFEGPGKPDLRSLESAGQLNIVLPHGAVVNVQATPGSLVFLAGSGASWLNAIRMRPVPHALRFQPRFERRQGTVQSFSQPVARSWHGRMFLPPWDAAMPAPKGARGDNIDEVAISFRDFRAAQRESITQRRDKAVAGNIDNGLGCGLGFDPLQSTEIEGGPKEEAGDHLEMSWALRDGKGYLRSLAGADDDCTGDTVKCWMQDMPVCHLPCGMDAVCVDTVTGDVVSGDITCPDGTDACELQCQDDASPNKTTSGGGFCTGPGLDMYMSGFTSIFQPGDVACLNLLFQDWTIASPWTFALACLGTICLAVGSEWLVSRRRKLFRTTPPSRLRDIILILLYGAQTILGYFIMVNIPPTVHPFCALDPPHGVVI